MMRVVKIFVQSMTKQAVEQLMMLASWHNVLSILRY